MYDLCGDGDALDSDVHTVTKPLGKVVRRG